MRIIAITLLVLSVICSLNSAPCHASIPRLINYQGKLTDSAGAPLNGSYALTFRLFNAEAAGTMLWEETHSGVVIQKGLFSVLLGSVTDLNLAFDAPYYLEIKVGTEVMSPRQQITAAAYSIRAEKADEAEGANKIKASGTDATFGYLSEKIDNQTLEVAGEKVRLKTPLAIQHGGTGKTVMNYGTVPVTSWEQSITLSTPHANTNYQVLVTIDMNGGAEVAGNVIWKVKSRSTTSFVVINNNGATITNGYKYHYWTIGD